MREIFKLPLVFSIALGAVSGATFWSDTAEARPSTKQFTCGGVRQFVRDRGAVVMNTKSPSIYRRFVSNSLYCDYREVATRFRVPTRSGRCTLYICKEPIFLRD